MTIQELLNRLTSNAIEASGQLGELTRLCIKKEDAHAEEIQALKLAHGEQLQANDEENAQALERLIGEYEKQLERLRDRIEEVEEAGAEGRALEASIEAGNKGVLATDTLAQKMTFDKLAERWEGLTASDLEALEKVLEGNYNLRHGRTWLI